MEDMDWNITTMARKIWVVAGAAITQEQVDDGCFPQEALGLIEWQFSNGPSGERGFSSDYYRLEDGLREHSGCIIIMESV